MKDFLPGFKECMKGFEELLGPMEEEEVGGLAKKIIDQGKQLEEMRK